MMENPSILDMPFSIFNEIRMILENQQTMKSFLEVLPEDCSKDHVLINMEVEGRSYNMTPAKYLLQYLGSKGKTVADLIQWFEAIQLHRALIHLRNPEVLSILEHPQEVVRIKEGERFEIVCHASSYPPPEYQWYKDDEELLLKVDPVLFIECANIENSGVYKCLVTSWNADNNAYDYLLSNSSDVQVIVPDVHASSSNSSVQQTNARFESIDAIIMPLPKTDEKILFIKQPYVNGKVAQGMSICLDVEVESTFPVSYQWYKDRKALHGENSNKLILKNLFPDLITGETKWEYQCVVQSKKEQVLSKVAIVELEETNDTTPYTATEKIAFLVANDLYDNLDNLMKPSADVADLSKLLSSLGFKIMAFRNLTLTEMRNAFNFFCKMLKPGSYALFSFSGHGFELYGQTYLQPVDCSENALHQESICSEYILQCMQETMPAVNILLIDACRNLPLIISGTSKTHDSISPGKIFPARMKSNTIYGYSTTFLSSAHESDNESNSLFVKHLKKYLLFDKSISEVFRLAQEDFAKDPLIRTSGSCDPIQAPAIKSTLAQPRKLSDPVVDSSSPNAQFHILKWCDSKRDQIFKTFHCSKFKFMIIVEFHHHKEAFCNGFDVYLYLYAEVNAQLTILNDISIKLNFLSPFSTFELMNVALKNTNLILGCKNLISKKEVPSLQKIKRPHLEGEVCISYCESYVQSLKFSISLILSELLLTINHLQSQNIEHSKLLVTPNLFS